MNTMPKKTKSIPVNHDLHVWGPDGSYHIGSLHIVVNATGKHREDNIYASVAQLMKTHHVHHPTVQVETTMKIAGFEIFDVKYDFFIHHYPEPIFENGIQLRHMIMLRQSIKLNSLLAHLNDHKE